MLEIFMWCMFNFIELDFGFNRFCFLFLALMFALAQKSTIFLESYGGDGCDCDDERMIALMLFVAMAMGMKIDLR